MEAVKAAHFAKKNRSGSTAVIRKKYENILFLMQYKPCFFNFSKLKQCDKIVDIGATS